MSFDRMNLLILKEFINVIDAFWIGSIIRDDTTSIVVQLVHAIFPRTYCVFIYVPALFV